MAETNAEEFWATIARVRGGASATPDGLLESLEVELSKLTVADLQAFEHHWSACLARAYTRKVWAAAYIIGGGCSDDAFWDFRSTLIMQGRAFFEAALADPDSLADADYSEDDENNYPFFEGYQYVAPIIEAKGGEELPGPTPHPKTALGDRWKDEDLPRLFPKLAAKFGWK